MIGRRFGQVLIAVPGFNHNRIGLQQRRGLRAANPLSQLALDPIENLTPVHAGGKLKALDAIPAGTFHQISDIKIKTLFWWTGSIHLIPAVIQTGCPLVFTSKMTNGASIPDFQYLRNNVMDLKSTLVSKRRRSTVI